MRDLRGFASAANASINSKDNKFQPEVFQEIVISIKYRILLLEQYSIELQPLEEAIRTGLLAFHTSMFLVVPGLKVTGNHEILSGTLRFAIGMLDTSTLALRDSKLWLLFIGFNTMFDFSGGCLRDAVKRAHRRRFESMASHP